MWPCSSFYLPELPQSSDYSSQLGRGLHHNYSCQRCDPICLIFRWRNASPWSDQGKGITWKGLTSARRLLWWVESALILTSQSSQLHSNLLLDHQILLLYSHLILMRNLIHCYLGPLLPPKHPCSCASYSQQHERVLGLHRKEWSQCGTLWASNERKTFEYRHLFSIFDPWREGISTSYEYDLNLAFFSFHVLLMYCYHLLKLDRTNATRLCTCSCQVSAMLHGNRLAG